MRKLSLITAILLLSSAWVLAQNSTPPTSDQQQYPSSAPSSQQAPDASKTATGDHTAQTVDGCIGGSAGNFTLTDASGKTYQLAGDTASLGDHVGHQVRVTGSADSGAASSGAGATPTFTVKKVKMISASCATK